MAAKKKKRRTGATLTKKYKPKGVGPSRKASELTLKDQFFIVYYLENLDAQDAAIKAGYSKSVAKTRAYQWVSDSEIKPLIYHAVRDAVAMRLKRLRITSDRVAVEMEKLAFSNAQDFYDDEGNLIPPHKLPRDVASAITEVTEKITATDNGEIKEIKYKTESKKGNLELLGKHLAMFTDRTDVISSDGSMSPADPTLTKEQALLLLKKNDLAT